MPSWFSLKLFRKKKLTVLSKKLTVSSYKAPEPRFREIWQIPHQAPKIYGTAYVPSDFENRHYLPQAPVFSNKARYMTPLLTAYRLWPSLVTVEEIRTRLNMNPMLETSTPTLISTNSLPKTNIKIAKRFANPVPSRTLYDADRHDQKYVDYSMAQYPKRAPCYVLLLR